jgi:capsule polysaccharide modification protein KpsS
LAVLSPQGPFVPGELAQWPEVLEAFIIRHRIDAVLLFGDCRPVHACVRSMTERLGCAFGVFEEGYLRPDHITFEPMGVNGHSHFERDWPYGLSRGRSKRLRHSALIRMDR